MKSKHTQLLDYLKKTDDKQKRSEILMKFSIDQLKKPLQIAVQVAAIVHSFDHELLNNLLETPLKADEFEELISLSYIEAFSKIKYNVHESSRKIILKQLWFDSIDIYKEYNRRAFHLFDEKVSENKSMCIEAIYHQLIIDTEKGIKSMEKFFHELIGRQYYSLGKAEALLSVVSEHYKENRLAGKFIDHLSWLQDKLEIVDKDDAGVRNPYKYLEYYDDNESKNFYGREEEIDQIVEDLERRFDNTKTPATVRIEGVSGSGKSSLLRAGVINWFLNKKEMVQYDCLVIRPEEFTDGSGKLLPVIGTFLNLINKKTDIEFASYKIADAINSTNPISASVELLAQHLNTTRLVIGIDQFEEILDILAGGIVENNWQHLIDFINCVIDEPNIGVVYTLESSRKISHKNQNLGVAFDLAGEIKLNNDEEFIKKVIALPFQEAGYELDEDVIKKLSTKFEKYQLPLLALKLSYLFDDIKEQYPPYHPKSKVRSQFDQDKNNQNDRTIKADGLNLDFEDIIEKQVEKAWVRGGQKWPIVKEKEQENLDHFLQPFISVNNNQIQLNAIPRNLPYRIEQKLAKSFFRERLLIFVNNNQMRLVHEAIIRNWLAASTWYEKYAPYLKMEARFKIEAKNTKGKPDTATKHNEHQIDEAAQILKTYIRSWSWKQLEISEKDKMLRSYCLTLFRDSQTPYKPIKTISKRKGMHVHLAASYGLVEVLKKFRAIDPKCLGHINKHNQWDTPLMHAAWAHESTVDYLLDHEVDPTEKNSKGWPAIAAAIQRGEVGIFHKLLEKTQDYTNKELESALSCPNNSTLLHICAQDNQEEMAKILVEDYGFNPKAEDDNKWQPIHYSAMDGANKTFSYFKTQFSLKHKDKWGKNCLHLATINGRKSILEAILKDNEAKEILETEDDTGNSALHLAAQYYQAECVKYLLNYIDPNIPNKNKQFPIHLAIAYLNDSSIVDQANALETVNALLSNKRTDPNVKDKQKRTPLYFAKKFPKIQKLLLTNPRLKLKEPIEKSGETPFTIAARLSLWPVFIRFVKQFGVPSEPNLDGKGNSFLHILAYENSPLGLLDNFLEDVEDDVLNAHNSKRQTPVFLAMKNKNWSVVKRLLATGRVDIQRDESETHSFLFHALELNASSKIIENLISAYPESLKEQDIMGWTILHQICRHQQQNWFDMIKPFISDLPHLWEQKDRMGRTPAYLLNPYAWKKSPIPKEHIDWPIAKSWDIDLSWEKLTKKKRDILIGQINDFDKNLQVSDSTQIMYCILAFYSENVRLIRLKQTDWKPDNVEIYFLSHNNKLFRLNSTFSPIYEINSKKEKNNSILQLTKKTVLDYLRFYCFFVRGEQGPFTILESLNQKEVPTELNDEDKDAIKKFAHPSWYNGWDKSNKAFYVAALVYYSDAIFEAEFKIIPTGTIKMLEDIPVAANFSAKINMPISFEEQ